MQELDLSDEETVEQIGEIANMKYFLVFAGCSSKAPFDPSMMVRFRKRFSEENLKQINELIVERAKAMVLEAVSSLPDNEDSDDPDDVSGDVRREDPEAPPLFCHHLFVLLRPAQIWCPLGGSQEHLAI